MRTGHAFVLTGTLTLVVLLAVAVGGCPGGGSTAGNSFFNLPPTAILTVIPDPARGVAPFSVQFDSSDSTDDGVIVRRQWNFGDGATSEEISPTHVYRQNGTYQVTLTLTDDNGAQDVETETVQVTERPVAIIQVDRDFSETAPATFNFDATHSFDPDGVAGDVLQYQWDFGDGAREANPVAAHTYAVGGSYRVILTVTDATGIPGTDEILIEVGVPRPTVAFLSPPPETRDLVITRESPLWTHVVFDVTQGVPYTIVAGLDLDRSSANANEIRLGTRSQSGEMNFTDLNLALPTPLSIANVELGTYVLWVEVRTDRTAPTRIYSPGVIHVVPPFTSTVVGTTPVLPPIPSQEWTVIPAPSSRQQIFDLGPLNIGDRLHLSLATVPGYSDSFNIDGYSIKILNAQQRLYAWYRFNRSLFTPFSKLIIGPQSASSHYYMVLDGLGGKLTPGVHVRIQRGAALNFTPRAQVIYLDFNGSDGPVAFANSPQIEVGPLVVTGMDSAVLAAAITDRVRAIFAPYVVTILSSAAGDPKPVGPHQTVYFDAGSLSQFVSNLEFWGLSDFLDPRNETATGDAIVAVDWLLAAFPALNNEGALGVAAGNAAAHHIGFLSGLHETVGVAADVMSADPGVVTSAGLVFTTAPLAAIPGEEAAIGIQDAPLLLSDLFR